MLESCQDLDDAVGAISALHYVLLHDGVAAGPTYEEASGDIASSAIYGFSSRASHNQFCSDIQGALIPYPRVSGRLQSRVQSPGLRLVISNALGPQNACQRAATAKEVLAAQMSGAPH